MQSGDACCLSFAVRVDPLETSTDTSLDCDGGVCMRLARTLDEMSALMAPMMQHAQRAYREFRPRTTDVIISSFPKCGTTWLQQIVHSLRTTGDMNFRDIYEVVPWIDVAPLLEQHLTDDQRANPRAFKSHLSWHAVPKRCRYIVSFREPKDAVVSFYRFLEGWFFEPGAIALDDFVAREMFDLDRDGTYWRHLSSWLSQRDNPDVLLLTFDEMKRDLRGVVERIAAFLDLDPNEERIETATRHSTFEFMSSHPQPFSEPLLRAWVTEHVGIPDGDAAKVRMGRVGRNREELSATTAARLDRLWERTIRAEFGYADYDQLVADLS